MKKQYMSLSLKQKAIEESGVLNGSKEFNDIFDILGVNDPAAKFRSPKKESSEFRSPNAGGIFATEGVEEMMGTRSPSRSPMKNSPRTVALRITDAGGNSSASVYTTPTKHQGASPAKGGANDQWEAWKEIQMQNDQIQQLEAQLQTLCSAMSLNHQQVLSKLDAATR
jgi:hypothetical protein